MPGKQCWICILPTWLPAWLCRTSQRSLIRDQYRRLDCTHPEPHSEGRMDFLFNGAVPVFADLYFRIRSGSEFSGYNQGYLRRLLREDVLRTKKIKRRTLRIRKGPHRLQGREYNQSEKSLLKIGEYAPKALPMDSEKAAFSLGCTPFFGF